MKNLFFLTLFLLGVSGSSHAQRWQNDLNAGLKEAGRLNKKVLLFFSVSQRCESCQKLEENIFKSPEFQSYAEEHFVLVKVDFSYDAADLSKEQLERNLLIVEKYNKDGFFPHVVVLNKDARIMHKVGVYGRETPKQYISLLNQNNRS